MFMGEDFLLSWKQSLYDGQTFLKMLTENSEIQKMCSELI